MTDESSRTQRIYLSEPNRPLLQMLHGQVRRVLDVGCGAGSNAAYLREQFPSVLMTGITISEQEALVARDHLDEVHVCDLENGFPADLHGHQFDAIIFSHVLEHLRDPGAVLLRMATLLSPGGQILIAVPNVLNWRMRLRFLRGDFTYEATGVLDSTHLRFFTYRTADTFLVPQSGPLHVQEKTVSGSVPQWLLRRVLLPRWASEAIDRLGCRLFPNLFGDQVLLRVTAGS